MPRILLFIALAALFSTVGQASEQLTGIACRSVHLGYSAPESVLFYNEITVEESAPGTYFMVCGFGRGYFGIQQLADDRKVVLFSVWDPGSQNNPNSVPEERRVKVLGQGEGVRVRRFGGEGTGGQSFYDYDWKVGETYRFVVSSRRDGERTVFTGYVYLPDEERWQQMATFSTLGKGQLIRGCYSFVEDFRRNRESTKQTRKANFGNGWVQTADGTWHSLAKARFTADGNKAVNIDAGKVEGDFFLATGGDITNEGTPLWDHMELEAKHFKQPEDLPDFKDLPEPAPEEKAAEEKQPEPPKTETPTETEPATPAE